MIQYWSRLSSIAIDCHFDCPEQRGFFGVFILIFFKCSPIGILSDHLKTEKELKTEEGYSILTETQKVF